MGIEPFLLSSSLLGVLAQRLVRVLCPECREPYDADASACALLGVDAAKPPLLYKARGCAHCNQLGYRAVPAFMSSSSLTRSCAGSSTTMPASTSWRRMRAATVRASARMARAMCWPVSPRWRKSCVSRVKADHAGV